MAQIESINWSAKRFYLHVDTVTNGFDAWEAFAEVRLLVEANANNEQNYTLFLHRQGKVAKDLAKTKFTPKYVSFNSGWRGVPYSGVDHELLLLTEMLNPIDGVSDRTMFDRTGLTNQVDIDPIYEQVEIIKPTAADFPTAAEIAQAVWDETL
jgi:hypothetical protein